ncbi:ABC transporter ATP-binding protein [Desertihabitans brevis]|uniref:ABC transporter ATP-binding protein n=1 Tax=Desertihabitans brevis TaxID=2268447 RepID=A0A367YTY7_9ACTN|nr:ABC transporter ATP-binding protein [Desertihabitans brevis]RCK68989.1 ABC transporter ATP-binding protein [Desertihabitans brevis]
MTRLLDARNLRAAYRTPDGRLVRAVDDVTLHVEEGEVLGVAGESGSGKSTLGAVLSLNVRAPLEVESGELDVEGKRQDFGASARIPRTWRGSVVSLLPQGAMNSISPTMRVRELCFDVIRAHDRRARYGESMDRVRERITDLGLPPRVLDAYPHQLSGGMKQRVVTVISTLLNPRLLIADEPTSALDVSSQRALMDMLKEMLSAGIMGGVIFITHDLPVLRAVSDRIAVMYAGKVVEVADAADLAERPRHPYSAALLASVLVPEPRYRTLRVTGIPGSPPSLADPPSGCRFHPRCELVMAQCRTQTPPVVGTELRHSACFWAAEHPGEPVPVGSATRTSTPAPASEPAPDPAGSTR